MIIHEAFEKQYHPKFVKLLEQKMFLLSLTNRQNNSQHSIAIQPAAINSPKGIPEIKK